MEFKYTLDPSADEPIMLINKHIGNDSEDGEGIMGDQFTRELMFLDTLNKKSIQVWINSGGGVVQDGEQIYHAILASKTPVDTVCTGTAASIAGPIFAAGRNRSMMDFAKLMMHPVSGGDDKSTKAFEQSIRTMLSSRSYLSEEQIQKMMNRTTWIFPTECKALGLCTDVDYSHGLNTNEIEVASTDYKEFRNITNKLIENKTTQKMKKVTNKLGINENSTEEVIIAAIETMENGYKAELAENKSKFDKYVDELASAKKSKEESDDKYNTLKAKFDAMEEESNKAKAESLKNEAKAFVAEGVKLGKIENKAEVIEKIENQYIANAEATKEIINAIPVSKAAPVINKVVGAVETGEEYTPIDASNTAGYVAKMNAKNLAKNNAKFK